MSQKTASPARPPAGVSGTECLHSAFLADAYRLHHDALIRFLSARVGREAAADIAQEVFAALIEAAPRLAADPRPLLPWLYGVARHRVADYARQSRSRPSALPLDAAYAVAARGGDSAAPLLLTALEQLTPSQRRIYVLRMIWGLSYEEISAQTSVDEAACRMQFSRARSRLRNLIAQSLVI